MSKRNSICVLAYEDTEMSGVRMARDQKSQKHRPSGKTLRVLFTCIGRRVSLLRAFQRAARQLHMDLEILGADCQLASPALQLCDHKYLVHPTDHRRYLADIREIVRLTKWIYSYPPWIWTSRPWPVSGNPFLRRGVTCLCQVLAWSRFARTSARPMIF